jgi:hypothetical protein
MKILEQAITELDEHITRCQAARAGLVALLESRAGLFEKVLGGPTLDIPPVRASGKRAMSAKARKAISRAQKARWAKWQKERGRK